MGLKNLIKNIFDRQGARAPAKPKGARLSAVLTKKKNKAGARPKKNMKKARPIKKKIAYKTKKNTVKSKSPAVSTNQPAIKIPPILREKEIGVITHYFGKIEVGIIKLKNTLRLGDVIHVKGAHDDFTQPVESMQIDHVDVTEAKKGDEIGIKIRQRVHEHDRVYRAPK